MSHLLQIALGPVQGFIAASRKTRDLAAGSELLVKLSGVAAKALEVHGANPIFPGGWDEKAANVLLVACDRPEAAAKAAKAAVLGALKERVHEAAEAARGLVDPEMKKTVLDAQAEGLLEFYAAWTRRTDDYARDRRRVGELLAARKGRRDFGPAPAEPRGAMHEGRPVEGRPKSPLHPAFAGVLRLGGGWSVDRGKTPDVRVKPREHLDAVGLVKRFGAFEGLERFPSTRTVAVGDLLAGAEDREAFESLVARANAALRGDVFDVGDALYGDLDDAPEAFREELRDLARKVRRDVPLRGYYAFLHGDGDSMGGLLDKLAEGEEGMARHREFSQRLGRFATEAKRVVEAHHGRLVYAGGDDVVALLPMATAVAAAVELRGLFRAQVEGWGRETVKLDAYPSLTVGVGFVHVGENLLDAYRFAKDLEAEGKRQEGKDRLVVGMRPRGGSDNSVALPFAQAARWTDAMAELKDGKLPRGYPYEVAALHRELARALRSEALTPDAALDLARKESARILKRKRDREGGEPAHELPEFKELGDLDRYARLLLTAHFATREGGEK